MLIGRTLPAARLRIVLRRDASAAPTLFTAADVAHLSRLGMVAQMATGLAHDLAQPLTAIENGAVACLARLGSRGSRTLREGLDEIRRQAMRGGQLVHRVKRFIMKRRLTRERADLNEVVADAVRLVEAEARDRRVRIELELDARPLPLRVDVVHVQQILLNLIRNAFDASDAPGATGRTLTVRTVRQATGRFAVEVCDRGQRPRGDYEDLFRSFHSTKRGGIGVGLTIGRMLAQLHGGQLRGEERDGGGSTFRLTLGTARVREPS